MGQVCAAKVGVCPRHRVWSVGWIFDRRIGLIRRGTRPISPVHDGTCGANALRVTIVGNRREPSGDSRLNGDRGDVWGTPARDVERRRVVDVPNAGGYANLLRKKPNGETKVSSDLELCYLSATEALSKFKTRTLSPVELMRAVIARSEAVNDRINAFTYTFYDRALDQAKRAEARYMKTDGRVRPLEGIPTAIKDFHPVKGEITTFGSKVFETFRPDNTAPTVERLLRAGAIMHCRTRTPEFAY